MRERKIPVLFGATASGKTALSLEAAKVLDAQIINMDALQIYRRLNIGTAKPTAEERAQVPHRLFDFADPRELYTVADYQRDALEAIRLTLDQGSLPLFVGGTGLYLSSLYYKYSFRAKSGDEEAYRKALAELGARGIYEQLVREGIPGARELDWKNPHRLFRAWTSREIHPAGERERSELPMIIFHLRQPREILWERIAQRTARMLESGLIEEVRGLLEEGLTDRDPAMKGIGYKETSRFLRGEISREELEEAIVVGTRQYAKRQETWVRNQYPHVIALDAAQPASSLIEIIRVNIKERK